MLQARDCDRARLKSGQGRSLFNANERVFREQNKWFYKFPWQNHREAYSANGASAWSMHKDCKLLILMNHLKGPMGCSLNQRTSV